MTALEQIRFILLGETRDSISESLVCGEDHLLGTGICSLSSGIKSCSPKEEEFVQSALIEESRDESRRKRSNRRILRDPSAEKVAAVATEALAEIRIPHLP